MVSLIGGVTGCVLGVILARLITLIASSTLGIEFVPTVKVVVLFAGAGVAICVGALSGFYPALKASKMSPVEAVRYG